LTQIMPNGRRWSQPSSGVVFISCLGEAIHVNRGPIATVDRFVDTGRVWNSADGDD
jgi:hypothetical protein